MSRRCSFFSQRIRLNGSDVPHACILFGVFGVECVTSGVVRFLVCCATFALSVGLLFFNAELFFFGPCIFERLVTNFSFDWSLR